MKKLILFLLLISLYFNVFSQNHSTSDSIKILESNLKDLKEIKSKVSDSLVVIKNKIDSLNQLIANARIEKINRDEIILEIDENTKLYEYASTALDFIIPLDKGAKVVFQKVADKNFLKVKYQDDVGYVNKYYLKNRAEIKEIYSAAILRGDIEGEKTDLDRLSEIYGKSKAKRILKERPEFADLVLSYGVSNAKKLIRKAIWIGMSESMARYVLGSPNDVNTTRGSWGTHEQWVYPDGKYLYFENGRLSSIQN